MSDCLFAGSQLSVVIACFYKTLLLWCFCGMQCKREGFLQKIKEEEGEGCNIYGFLEVNKVAGNFHFAPGKSFQQSNVHVHDILAFQKDSFNVSCVMPFISKFFLHVVTLAVDMLN